ncbi:hypothetical protein ABET41_20075 [Metabacillus fastidiosus]|uniref:Lipoprotein n=1 Tax=Metabacillus fastidiosus TaxID=1458 RepID=A0ABU6P1A5_9BACI|nr:hypothetical protein [Metabacillus fastidiosus]
MKKFLVSCHLIVLLLLFLVGCEEKKMSMEPKQNTVTYKENFPVESSPALTKFMSTYFNQNNNLLVHYNNQFVYSKDNANAEEREIAYYEFNESVLEKSYGPLLGKKVSEKELDKIAQSQKKEWEQNELLADTKQYKLPSIVLKENNQLEVKTAEGEKTIDLPELLKEYGVKESDELVINMRQVNDQMFTLDIQDLDIEDPEEGILYIGLFIKPDLSDFTASKLMNKDLQAAIDSSKLDAYKDSFNKVGDSKRYALVFEDAILDLEENQIIEIKESDYLSNDGKYIYINGAKDKLEDGIQKIQTIENYAAGNDVYETEFMLDYEKIAKELEFVTSGIGLADINYFNEKYVVLSLTYNGKVVGEAGFTNVIIDLQNDKTSPIFYLVDLGLLSVDQMQD